MSFIQNKVKMFAVDSPVFSPESLNMSRFPFSFDSFYPDFTGLTSTPTTLSSTTDLSLFETSLFSPSTTSIDSFPSPIISSEPIPELPDSLQSFFADSALSTTVNTSETQNPTISPQQTHKKSPVNFQVVTAAQILADLQKYSELRSQLQILHNKLASQEEYLRETFASSLNNSIKSNVGVEIPSLDDELDLSSFHQPMNNKRRSERSESIGNTSKRVRGNESIVNTIDLTIDTPRSSTAASDTFVCTECGRNFARKFNLQQHMKLHQEKVNKPYSCSEPGCMLSFTREYDLKRHHLTVHESEDNLPFTCPEPGCGQKFPRKDALARHVKKHESA